MDKSILILCVFRSGSTALAESFHKSFKIYQEPLNYNVKSRTPYDSKEWSQLIKNKNIVVKEGVLSHPYDLKESYKNNMEEQIYIETVLKNFDHVILLDRKNDKLQKESWERMIEKGADLKIDELGLQKSYLRKIAQKYNLKIHYYEDIFYRNSEYLFNELGIDLNLIDFRFLDSKYKYENGSMWWNTKLKKIIQSADKSKII